MGLKLRQDAGAVCGVWRRHGGSAHTDSVSQAVAFPTLRIPFLSYARMARGGGENGISSFGPGFGFRIPLPSPVASPRDESTGVCQCGRRARRPPYVGVG